MSVLIDKHHADLFYALQRLFEDHLDLDVYTPVGHEWWDEGYWRFGEGYGDDRLARQFLTTDGWDHLADLYLTFDLHHPDRTVYGIDVATARQTDWSHVVATVQDNQAGFARFAREVGAKYVYHVGNTRQQIDWSLDPLVLNASEAPLAGRGVNIGQEFDHTTTFRYRPPVTAARVTSFVNLLPLIHDDAGRLVSWEPFEGLRSRLPSYDFRSFGHECPDGFRRPVEALADEMALAGWAYHDKVTGDGFGHVIHNWAAVGRPLIGHARYYAGQRAEPLWRDLETCIDLDKHDLDEAARIIREITPERHAEMCRAIRETLETIYDPEADAEAVRGLL